MPMPLVVYLYRYFDESQTLDVCTTLECYEYREISLCINYHVFYFSGLHTTYPDQTTREAKKIITSNEVQRK